MSVEILHGDCMEYMAGLPDKAFDLAIVDPPYGIGSSLVSGGSNSGGWHRMVASGADVWDVAPPDKYFSELMRVSRDQIIWDGNYFALPPSRKPLCWNKLRPNQKNASEWEYAWTSFDGRAQMFTHCANGGFILAEPRIHPTQKPVKLYRWLMANFAKPGWRILDTHLGSGSSAIAAHEMGFDFVGLEIEEEYVTAARKRFDLMTRQQTLDL